MEEVDGRLHRPSPTPYGLNEGAHVDPDGNLFRFGSPAQPRRAIADARAEEKDGRANRGRDPGR